MKQLNEYGACEAETTWRLARSDHAYAATARQSQCGEEVYRPSGLSERYTASVGVSCLLLIVDITLAAPQVSIIGMPIAPSINAASR